MIDIELEDGRQPTKPRKLAPGRIVGTMKNGRWRRYRAAPKAPYIPEPENEHFAASALTKRGMDLYYEIYERLREEGQP